MVIRVRPPLPRELQGLRPYEHTVAVDPGQRVITLSENLASLQGAKGTGTATFDNGMERLSTAAHTSCQRAVQKSPSLRQYGTWQTACGWSLSVSSAE